MKHSLLLLPLLLSCQLAAGQSAPGSYPDYVLAPLVESAMRRSESALVPVSAPGVRYQYQLVHLHNSEISLAPAWRGQTKLEPPRKFINPDFQSQLDGLLMNALNEIAADGWDLLEVHTVSQPVEAVHKVERELQFNDPNRPVYKGTTSISSTSHTRYLFRRALPTQR